MKYHQWANETMNFSDVSDQIIMVYSLRYETQSRHYGHVDCPGYAEQNELGCSWLMSLSPESVSASAYIELLRTYLVLAM